MNISRRWTRAQNWITQNRVRVLLLFCGVLAPLILFGALAEDVRDRETLRFDAPIQWWAHGYESPGWNNFMLAWTRLGTPFVMLALCGAIALGLWLKNRRGDALFFAASVLGAALVSIGIPKDSIVEYETQIKAGKFMVIAHGELDALDKGIIALESVKHESVKQHSCCG